MASVYRDGEKKKTGSSAGTSDLSKAVGSTAGTAVSSSDSGGYAARVGALSEDSTLAYTPGDSVTSAKNYLDEVIASRPGSYSGKYTEQLDQLYDQIMNRAPAAYDVSGDAMYDAYAQAYRRSGLKNMRDAVGAASAQTGGYGNSWAQTSGQSAYNQAMSALAEQIPALRESAAERYDDETQRLSDLYAAAQSADESDYQRYADRVAQWQNERSWASDAYDRAYSDDYTAYADSLSNAKDLYGLERDDAKSEMSQAQTQAKMYIQAGIMPSSDLLAKTGWDTESVRKLVRKNR